MCWFCKVILVWVFKMDPNRNKTIGRDVPQGTDITVSCEVMKLQCLSSGKRSERQYNCSRTPGGWSQ